MVNLIQNDKKIDNGLSFVVETFQVYNCLGSFFCKIVREIQIFFRNPLMSVRVRGNSTKLKFYSLK